MSFVPIQEIVEFSELQTTQWDIKFQEALNAASKQFENFTQKITTSELAVNIPFINSWEDLENIELYGDPSYTTVRAQTINRKIERYARGLSIGIFDFKSATAQSMFNNQLDALVAAAARRRTKAIMDALKNGENAAYTKANVYDDGATEKALFANDHNLNGVTYDNLYSGDISATTIREGLTRFATIPLGPGGEYLPMAGSQIFCVIPPQLEYTLDLIINSTTVYEANINATNPYKGIVEKIVDNYLADDANDWYMIQTMPSLSPFVTVEHATSNPSLQPFISEDDREVAEKKRYRWLLDLEEETYPVHYFQMIKWVNT